MIEFKKFQKIVLEEKERDSTNKKRLMISTI